MTAGGPQFSATPQNPDLLRWIGIQVVLLVLAWVIGMVVRRGLGLLSAGVGGSSEATRAQACYR